MIFILLYIFLLIDVIEVRRVCVCVALYFESAIWRPMLSNGMCFAVCCFFAVSLTKCHNTYMHLGTRQRQNQAIVFINQLNIPEIDFIFACQLRKTYRKKPSNCTQSRMLNSTSNFIYPSDAVGCSLSTHKTPITSMQHTIK